MKLDGTVVDGTSTPLTVESAKQVFESLDSAPEDQDTRETPEAEEDDRPESTDEQDAPTGDDAEAQLETEDATDDTAEDSETDDEQPEVETRPVIVDGKEVGRVTFEEAVKGYTRTADHTRKTQAAAAARKEAEALQAEARKSRDEYAGLVEKVQRALESSEAEPDWDKIQQESPAEFPALWATWQRDQKRREKVRAEYERVTKERQEDAKKQVDAFVQAETERLLEIVPEWKDPGKRKAARKELVEYALSVGFSEDEVLSLVDHRHILMLRKAMQHDRQVAKQQKVAPQVAEKIKTAKPGSSTVKSGKGVQVNRAMQRLSKSGRQADAARVFYELEE